MFKTLCTFLFLSLISSPTWAGCFKRFYTDAHIATKKKQEVVNLLFSVDTWSEEDSPFTDMNRPLTFQIQYRKNRKGPLITMEQKGWCNRSFLDSLAIGSPGYVPAPFKCRLLDKAQSTLEFNTFDVDKLSMTGKLQSGAEFVVVAPAEQKGELQSISNYDSTMKLYSDQGHTNDYETCSDIIMDAGVHAPGPRFWNELILHSIRNDLARPTVTARNLFHLSAALWDVYSAYTPGQPNYFVNVSPKQAVTSEFDITTAMSYAAYEILKERYKLAPVNQQDLLPDGEFGNGEEDQVLPNLYKDIMTKLRLETDGKYGIDLSVPKNLGGFVALQILASQLEDGSRESENYSPDPDYKLINNSHALDISQSGLRDPLTDEQWKVMTNDWSDLGSYEALLGLGLGSFNAESDIDYWQPLYVPGAIDQGGSAEVDSEQAPLTLFWGRLPTFSNFNDKKTFPDPAKRPDEFVYFDPGSHYPLGKARFEEMVRKNLQVVEYSALLNPVNLLKEEKDFDGDGNFDINPGALPMDISPASQGNHTLGTNNGTGYPINEKTGAPYEPHEVTTATFYRSLAEFWADGPDSETPPGHWNTLLNYVFEQLEKKTVPLRWKGKGDELSKMEYQLRAYLTLNGALHDAAVVAWGIKGFYQGNRPVSVIRQLADMCEKDPDVAKEIIALSPDHLKMVQYDEFGTTVNKLFVKSWRGTLKRGFHHNGELRNFVYQDVNPLAFLEEDFYYERGVRGVGWIPAENWQPYQKPSFVTPPFPGFVSGHSTFSRAAAEVLTHITGDKYFPGGLGTFEAPELEFEWAEHEKFEFQWATYYDAADQSGISRIYGGIHASYDDLPARKIGAEVGIRAGKTADQFFNKAP
ncbi:MAG: vanadium-dependent haloperoxidase [Pseudomonadota bacterium]